MMEPLEELVRCLNAALEHVPPATRAIIAGLAQRAIEEMKRIDRQTEHDHQ